MKPTSHGTDRNRRIGDQNSRQFPLTDSANQSLSLDGYRGGCASTCAVSFRSISTDYFKNEARQSFVSEAAFFAMIVVTAAWPVLQSIHAMMDLVRAYSGI